MEKNLLFMTAQDIVEVTGMSEAYAYKLIKKLNTELEQKGYITIKGRVSKDYFEERVYGTKGGEDYASLQG
ncbi:MAG: DNA-binding protein [Erysipelotrichales bacterium]|nr:DNA-binding protein [Erysipelotrichales bacterium]